MRFACLAGLGPSPRSSSSSSISSSEGEDPRPEPELWQHPLQGELVGGRWGPGARPRHVSATLTPALFLPERDHLPSSKGLGTLSPQRGGPRAGCSPGEGSRRREPGQRCDFSAGEPGVSGGGERVPHQLFHSPFTFIKRLFSSSSLSAIRVVSSAYLRLLILLSPSNLDSRL